MRYKIDEARTSEFTGLTDPTQTETDGYQPNEAIAWRHGF